MTDFTILLVLGLATTSCKDNEQRAREMGTEARDTVARACDADAGDDDGACTDERCRGECARPDVPRGFGAACLDACRQTGACATSADCGAGRECVAIAPVVRRCVAKTKEAQ